MKSLSGNGRGPTIDISPLSTFQSCGNSSTLQRRTHRPTRETRGSFGILKSRGSPVWFKCARDGLSASAPSTIVRNLSIKNGRPPVPMRRWRKITGPGEVSLMSPATASTTGATTGEGCPGREVAARGVRADEKSARGAGGATDHPGVHGVDREADGDEAEPDDDSRDAELCEHEAQSPVP